MYVAVCGPGEATTEQAAAAEEVGRLLAGQGAIVVCGGLGGVMAAACRGAQGAGATTVGLLPGGERSAANPHVTVAIPTGLGELRNGLIVRSADAVIAMGAGYGTLSEIALALKSKTPVIGLQTWPIEGVHPADSPQHAVELAIRAAT